LTNFCNLFTLSLNRVARVVFSTYARFTFRRRRIITTVVVNQLSLRKWLSKINGKTESLAIRRCLQKQLLKVQ